MIMKNPFFSPEVAELILGRLCVGITFPEPKAEDYLADPADFLELLLRNRFIHPRRFQDFVGRAFCDETAKVANRAKLGGFPMIWPAFSWEFPRMVLATMPIEVLGTALIRPKSGDDPRTVLFRWILDHGCLPSRVNHPAERAIADAVSESLTKFGEKRASLALGSRNTIEACDRAVIGYAMRNTVVAGRDVLPFVDGDSPETFMQSAHGLLDVVMRQLLP